MAASEFRLIVWPSAVAQTFVWAAMFYSFPALIVVWERDLGWSKTELTGAYTLALIVSALLAPSVGRLIDRGYARVIFSSCTLLGAAALFALSKVTQVWQFYAVWTLLGIAMAGTLYEACFALLTRCMGTQARRAITLVTLVAGFAGTVSFPGTYALLTIFDWRGTVVVWGLAMMVIVLPLVWLASKAAEARAVDQAVRPSPTALEALGVMRRASFWLLATAFAMVSLNHSMLLTHLLPLLAERSVASATAVVTAGLIGPMQVVGRLLMLAMEQRTTSFEISVACFLALMVGALVLLGAGAAPLLLVGFAFFQGAGRGTESIVRPVITAELLGRKNFGVIAGLMALAFVGAGAMGPTIGSFVWGLGGYDLVIWLAGGVAVLGLAALVLAAKLAGSGR